MANEFYTLIIVPHAKARFRRLHVSVRLTKWLAGIATAAVLTVSGILVHYVWITAEVYELRRLRSENRALRVKTEEYEQNAGQLRSKIDTLQGMVNKLGVMAGLDHSLPDTRVGGVGGAVSSESTAPTIDPIALHEMDRSVSALTARSARLEEFYRDQSVLLASTPSIWPVRGYLAAGFGNRLDPFTGQRDFHTGLDISTPVGTKVQAPADGVIVSCGQKGGYGNSIILDHGFGIVTRYGHLLSAAVKRGQVVDFRQDLGLVGSSGRSTGSHVHYEVLFNGNLQARPG